MPVVNLHTYANGLPRGLDDVGALRLVHDLAAQGGRVVFSQHALARMQERHVDTQQVLQVLLRGEIDESVSWLADRQCYQLALRALTAGDVVRVACAIEVEPLMGQVVVVITVMA